MERGDVPDSIGSELLNLLMKAGLGMCTDFIIGLPKIGPPVAFQTVYGRLLCERKCENFRVF